MYSTRTVECVLNPDEVVNQRRYGALPLTYGADCQVDAGGTRTHNLRLLRHVLRNGSQDVFKSNDRRGCDQRCTLLSHLSYVPGNQAETVGLEPTTRGLQTMYSNRQSVMYLSGDEVVDRDLRSHVSSRRCIRQRRRQIDHDSNPADAVASIAPSSSEHRCR